MTLGKTNENFPGGLGNPTLNPDVGPPIEPQYERTTLLLVRRPDAGLFNLYFIENDSICTLLRMLFVNGTRGGKVEDTARDPFSDLPLLLLLHQRLGFFLLGSYPQLVQPRVPPSGDWGHRRGVAHRGKQAGEEIP